MLARTAAIKEQSSPIDNKLSDYYSRWFEIIPADTPALRDQVFRLRYQVYCCEHKYETPEEHLQKLEMDAFDCRSVHSLIVERASGTAAGTVRLILPDPKSLQSSLPIQKVCRHPLFSILDSSYAAEVSRFAISKEARKALNVSILNSVGKHVACPIAAKDLAICFISLGLMRATVQMSFAHGVTEWFAVMEPALLRLLRSFGICFNPLGPLVQYHGLRQPCYANLGDILENVREEHFDLWEFVTERGDWPIF